MRYSESDFERVRSTLRWLIEENASAPWASYAEEELAQDAQDIEDATRVTSVAEAFRFLRDQGGRTSFLDYRGILDPLDGFATRETDDTSDSDEADFRRYLTGTYGIPAEEFP